MKMTLCRPSCFFLSSLHLIQQQSLRAASGSLQQLYCGTWDPHHADVIATSADSSFATWDLRAGKKAVSVDGAHFLQIRDLEFNRVQEHILVRAWVFLGSFLHEAGI